MTSFRRTLAVLEQGRASGEHLGAQIYVSRKGRVLIDAGVGESRPGVAMQPDTVNVWFSSGKPVTAVAVARLCEAGNLDLDQPVAAVIPEFGVRGKEGIRLRHLLNHTAGFRGADRVSPSLPWDEAIRAICEVPLEPDWVPGRRAGYQLFSSWTILGELVRRRDGRAIDRHVGEEFFRPLELPDCWVGVPADQFAAYGDRMGWMHFMTQGRLRPHPVWNEAAVAAVVRPGGSLRGPIRALGMFYEGLMGWREGRLRSAKTSGTGGDDPGNAPLIRAETVQEFCRSSRGGLFDETFRHVMDWGLGFGVNSNRYGAETVPYGFGRFASEQAFGHGGSQSSVGFVDPAHELVVAWICNGMIGEEGHQVRARRLNEAIYEDLGF